MSESLRVTEIFLSLQGESRTAGWPTVFIRLTGCPLRCHYCDTAYAFTGGESMSQLAILDRVRELSGERVKHVCVTGGEPLAQKGCWTLLQALCDAGYEVSLETSGALDMGDVDPRVSRVMDIKTPGSGEAANNRWENLELLNANDQVKFVLTDGNDYDWSVAVLEKYRLHETCEVLFSSAHGQLGASTLADWIVADKLPVRFQIQLHKWLWGEEQGR